MQALDLAAFRATPLVREPFPYLIVPGFVRAEARGAIHADYPHIESPGSFPVSELTYGPSFAWLLQTLTGKEMRQAFEEKFQLKLNGLPTMVTVRGRSGTKDGNIHTDAKTKIITVLIYMNPAWEQAGGRLRLLRSPDNIEDVIAEIPPLEGTLVAFRRSDNSYHGHKPFIGPRRVIQLNWVTGERVRRFELMRHRLSAWMKKLVRGLQPQPAGEYQVAAK
jgi:SM-20-related protein